MHVTIIFQETAFKILRRRKTIGRHLTMNEHDEEDLSLKTVEDISRTAEKMVIVL